MWAYHDYGIFAFTPEISGIDADYDQDGRISEIEMLRWSDEEKGGRYYVDWTPFDHPQLGRVEIGGWVKKIAPIDRGLEKVCREHTEFNLYHASLSPLVRITSFEEEEIADGVYRIEAVVSNTGFLPTYVSQMALANHRDFPIIVSLQIDNGSLVSGKSRQVIGHLEGNAPRSPGYFLFAGGSQSLPSKRLEWVVKKGSPSTTEVTVRSSCKKGGSDSKSVTLKD